MFVGMDVNKNYLQVAVLDEKGSIVNNSKVDNKLIKINELESLGLSVKKINEFNDLDEIRDLTEIIKQDKYLDYKTDYLSVSLP